MTEPGALTLLQPGWLAPALMCLVAMARRLSEPDTNQADHGWQGLFSVPVLRFLAPARNAHSPSTRWPWLVAALACCALTQPSIRAHDSPGLQHTNAWLFVADVSRSMNVNDVIPSRLAAMRDTMLGLADRAAGRAIGLVVFAGDAFLAVPPAFDQQLLREHITLLEHGIVPLEGSNTARALSLTARCIADSQLLHANVFLFSDTGGLGSDADAAARQLHRAGHRLDLVRIGTSGGDPTVAIDVQAGQQLVEAGQGRLWVASALGVLPLSSMARSALRAESRNAELQALIWRDQSHWLLLAGIPLILAWFSSLRT